MFKFNIKGWKSFYKSAFNIEEIKAEFLYTLGIYKVDSTSWCSKEEKETLESEAEYIQDDTVYLKNKEITLTRVAVAPILFSCQLLFLAIRIAFIIGTFPIILIHNIRLEI